MLFENNNLGVYFYWKI